MSASAPPAPTTAFSDLEVVTTPRTRASGSAARAAILPEPFAQTGEYSILGLTRSADQSLVRERQVGFTIVLFGVATVIALLYSIERYFYSRLVGDPVSLTELVPAELIFTYAWALLTPVVMYGAKRFPVWGQHRSRNWALQLTALVGFVLVHIALFSLAMTAVHSGLRFATLP